MSSKPKTADLHVRVDPDLMVTLQTFASSENKQVSDYVRDHLRELVEKYPGRVIVEQDVPTPVPYEYAPEYFDYPEATAPPAYPYRRGRGYYIPRPAPKSQMDKMIEELTKMYQVKIMTELLQGKSNLEEYFRSVKGDGSGKKADSFDFNDLMKWQTLQNALAMQESKLQAQLEQARTRGDKSGENKLMEAILALQTMASQQSQQFLTQLMTQQQNQSQSQRDLFTVAIEAQKSMQTQSAQDHDKQEQRFLTLTNAFHQAQLQSAQQIGQIQLDQLRQELQRISVEKKDWIEKLDEFVQLRDKSPVYKAVFDHAFGVKEESTIGKILPQLKEMGLDRFLENIGKAVVNFVQRPKIQPPTPMVQPRPQPTSPMMVIPPPPEISGIPSTRPEEEEEKPLEELHLPPSPSERKQPTTTEEETPKSIHELPADVGYTNLQALGEESKSSKEESKPKHSKRTKPT